MVFHNASHFTLNVCNLQYFSVHHQPLTIVYLLLLVLQLKEAIEEELRQSGLQVTPFTMTKVIQLYETKNSRHSSMLVGKTGSAKSVTWRTLQNAITALYHKGEPGFQLVQVSVDREIFMNFPIFQEILQIYV